MSSLHFVASSSSVAAGRTSSCFHGLKPAASTRRVLAAPVAALKQQNDTITRREGLVAAVASVATATSLLGAAPAYALFGFGEDTETVLAKYTADTKNVLALTNETLAAPRDDPTREQKVKALRKEINSWVAAYRRQDKVAGRPSFGNTYSALNALAGHFNSFGVEAPVPKKRLDRLTKELKDADLYLSRGR